MLQNLMNRLGDQDEGSFTSSQPNWVLVQVERQEGGGSRETADVTHKLDAEDIRRQAGGARETFVCPIPADATFRVGRAEGSGMYLPDGGVSKNHADLGWVAGQLVVEDLGSTNGTFVNRRKLKKGERVTLRADDQVRFGFGETFQVMSPTGLFRYMDVLRRFGF